MVEISRFFLTTKSYNALIIGQDNEKFRIFSFNPFTKGSMWFYELQSNITIDDAFPDKQKDLNDYPYKILFHNEYPRLFVNKKKLQGSFNGFLTAVATHQNAKLSLRLVASEEEIKKNFGNVDLIPNTDIFLRSFTPGAIRQVNTFQTDGYCAMLPNPERTSFFSYVMKPFDIWVWISSALATIMFAVIWRYLNRNFSIVTYILHFFGENLSFPQRRLIEKVMLLMKYFLVFIITLGYESFIITYMANSRNGERLKTVNELLNSNFTFIADTIFTRRVNSSEFFPELSNKIMTNIDVIGNLNFKKLAQTKTGLILTCNSVDVLYHANDDYVKVDKTAIDFYYQLPEKLHTFYLKFTTGIFSPFTDRLQDLSLKFFEGGLGHLWKSMIEKENMKAVREREAIESGDYLMGLGDIAGAFYILGVGLALAALVFVFELIWGYGHEIYWYLP